MAKGMRSQREQTPQSVLAEKLIEALRELGGSAKCVDVVNLMEKKLQGRLLPGDMEPDDHHQLKWKHQAHWARDRLKLDGVIRDHSPRGYWQLNDEYR